MDLIYYQIILWGPQLQNMFLKYAQEVTPGVICIYWTVDPTVPKPQMSLISTITQGWSSVILDWIHQQAHPGGPQFTIEVTFCHTIPLSVNIKATECTVRWGPLSKGPPLQGSPMGPLSDVGF